MDWLIVIGAVLSLVGLVGLLASAFKVMKAKKENLSDDDLRARVQKAMAVNMGGLALSVIGLMCVILGVSLS
jgi:multisubunit Na+/H+ antiporter MnhG subunit